MTQGTYPFLGNNPTPERIAEILQEITRLRERDVEDFDNLPNIFMRGRKVAKIPTQSTDVALDDRAGDFNYDTSYIYVCVDTGSGLAWRRTTLSSWITGGGPAVSDPWTFVNLASDLTVGVTTNTDSLLKFTPAADKKYWFQGRLFLQSSVATTGPRPGIKWPTAGVIQNIGFAIGSNSTTAFASRFWGGTTTANAASTGVSSTAFPYYGSVEGVFETNGSIAGDLIVTLASEVGASNVTLKAGSFLAYREI